METRTRTGLACKFEMQTAHPCHSITQPDDSSSSLDGWQSISSVRQISVCFHWSAPRNRATWLPEVSCPVCLVCPGSLLFLPLECEWVTTVEMSEWLNGWWIDDSTDWRINGELLVFSCGQDGKIYTRLTASMEITRNGDNEVKTQVW